MLATRLSVLAATAAAIVLPAVAAPAATAAPAPHSAVTASCHKTGPWKMHASAVKLHSRASGTSTTLGILYKSHAWSHGKISGGWVYVHDTTTGVSGWASMRYVYPTVYTCLH